MKSSSILLLLALAIAPTLSQPHDRATGETPQSASINERSSSVPSACLIKNVLVADQLDEIAKTRARGIPVTPDLAGYFYATIASYQMLGCPPIPGTAPKPTNGSSDVESRSLKRSSSPAGASDDPCVVMRNLDTELVQHLTAIAGPQYPSRLISRGGSRVCRIWTRVMGAIRRCCRHSSRAQNVQGF